jgi:hypothetical protein
MIFLELRLGYKPSEILQDRKNQEFTQPFSVGKF